MIGLILLLVAGDVGARIGESAVAAQAFQGPLDGDWTLRDAAGRELLRIQIVDPVSRPQALAAAWRDPTSGQSGFATAQRQGDGLSISLGESGDMVVHQVASVWRGRLIHGHQSEAVSLSRTGRAAAIAASSSVGP